MKKALTCTIFLFCITTLFSQHQDHILWFKEPAKVWDNALPVGNGRLGAMVFGDYIRETIQLNEESLWGGCPTEADAHAAEHLPKIQELLINGEIEKAAELSEKHMKSNPLRIRSYQTFGDLHIDFLEGRNPTMKVNNYRRSLDLQQGISTVSYESDGVKYEREIFASATDNIIAIRLTGSKPGKLTFRLHYQREQDATTYRIGDNELGITGQIIDLPAKDHGPSGPHMKFNGRIWGENKGGKLTVLPQAIYVEEADEVVFYFTAATDYNFSELNYDRNINPEEICQNILKKATTHSYNEIKKRHIEEHSTLFDRVIFNMGYPSNLPTDERLRLVKNGATDLSLITLYFQYGRYLLMGSSRSPGIFPANLQGIWNNHIHAPWSSDFHTNINIQMNYWPAEVCNLSETVLPFSNLINALRKPGRITAHKTYNSKGWTVNHLTNPFGHTSISDGVGWGTLPIAGSWLVLHQWEHFLFTNDLNYLKTEAYPSMKEAAEFILGYLVPDTKGQLVTAPSNSPENRYRPPNGKVFMLTYGATMDIEIITELFEACLEAAKIVKDDPIFSKQLRATLRKLPPIKVSEKYQTIQEWIEDYEEVEPGHRHISHLFGLYPGTSIHKERKDLFEAARKTIERRRFYNESEENRQGSYTGWSRAWMICFYARLLDGEEAGLNVQEQLKKTTLDNLFNTHPPFQIDGNFGATAGIAEMLLQSHTDELHLLPALPSFWKKGEMNGLCARHGLVVDLKWENGQLISAKIHSQKNKKIKVRYRNQVKTKTIKAGEPLVLEP